MFPPSFLGTRADVLIDIVTLSFVAWIIYVHTLFAVLASLTRIILVAITVPPLYYFGFIA